MNQKDRFAMINTQVSRNYEKAHTLEALHELAAKNQIGRVCNYEIQLMWLLESPDVPAADKAQALALYNQHVYLLGQYSTLESIQLGNARHPMYQVLGNLEIKTQF